MKKTLIVLLLAVLLVPSVSFAATDSALLKRIDKLEKRIAYLEAKLDIKESSLSSKEKKSLETKRAELLKKYKEASTPKSGTKLDYNKVNSLVKQIQEVDKKLGTSSFLCTYSADGRKNCGG